MFRYLCIAVILFYLPLDAKIYKIPPNLLKNMTTNGSYKPHCPTKHNDLRVVEVVYLNFADQTKTGKLIVNKLIAKKTAKIFDKLYKIKYQIKLIKPIYIFKANDYNSIAANNTSAYNCRKISNTNKWSNHAYGMAIDINPLQNPYISRSGQITHKTSKPFIDRTTKVKNYKAMIQKNSYIVKLFKTHGFKWGGDWRTIKDYQHFEYKK